MNIFCFGCSFTGGVYDGEELRESWPYRLSINFPKYKIYNFGRQATSVLFSINMIEQSTAQLKSNIILTQLTEPTRMTFYDDGFRLNLQQHVVQLTDNYFVLKHNINEIHPVNAVSGKKQMKEVIADPARHEKYKTFEKLIAMHDDFNHFDPEYRSFFYRAQSLSNKVFFHRKLLREVPGLESIDCVEKLMGTEKFLDLVVDKGFHFGQSGAEWIADWLSEEIRSKYH